VDTYTEEQIPYEPKTVTGRTAILISHRVSLSGGRRDCCDESAIASNGYAEQSLQAEATRDTKTAA
jgi:hypothetical protein